MSSNTKQIKIRYILSHPIQYQTPLIQYLVGKKIDLFVNYRSNISIKKFYDPGFKKKIKWDVNLMKGYQSKFLTYIGPNKTSSLYPLTTEIFSILRDKQYKIIWLHGIKTWYNLLIIILSPFYNKKILVRDETWKFSKQRSLLNKIYNKFFYFIIDKFVDFFLSIGTANKLYYIENNISKKKIASVPYVTNNKFFSKNIKQIKTKLVFLYAGKINKERKGIDLLLQAIHYLHNKNLLNNIEFNIVGDGEMKSYLDNYIKENNFSHTRSFGFQNQTQLSKHYQNSHVYIMPSRIEPWGLGVNEAMAAGNAILCSDKVGSKFDLVKNNKNGRCFKSGCHRSLAKEILFFIKNKKKIYTFQTNSKKIISSFNFHKCYLGLLSACKQL